MKHVHFVKLSILRTTTSCNKTETQRTGQGWICSSFLKENPFFPEENVVVKQKRPSHTTGSDTLARTPNQSSGPIKSGLLPRHFIVFFSWLTFTFVDGSTKIIPFSVSKYLPRYDMGRAGRLFRLARRVDASEEKSNWKTITFYPLFRDRR